MCSCEYVAFVVRWFVVRTLMSFPAWPRCEQGCDKEKWCHHHASRMNRTELDANDVCTSALHLLKSVLHYCIKLYFFLFNSLFLINLLVFFIRIFFLIHELLFNKPLSLFYKLSAALDRVKLGRVPHRAQKRCKGSSVKRCLSYMAMISFH